RRESDLALREALSRSESVVALFRTFQESTPQDLWLSRTSLANSSTLVVESYSLTRQSPLLLAKALGQTPWLSEIAVPQVAESDWLGEPVYRFRMEDAFDPKGAFRP